MTFKLTDNRSRLQVTVHEWISRESSLTGATGQVIDHRAISVLTARAGTGVLALGPDAGQIRGAI